MGGLLPPSGCVESAFKQASPLPPPPPPTISPCQGSGRWCLFLGLEGATRLPFHGPPVSNLSSLSKMPLGCWNSKWRQQRSSSPQRAALFSNLRLIFIGKRRLIKIPFEGGLARFPLFIMIFPPLVIFPMCFEALVSCWKTISSLPAPTSQTCQAG